MWSWFACYVVSCISIFLPQSLLECEGNYHENAGKKNLELFSLNMTLPTNRYKGLLKNKETVESTQDGLATMNFRTGWLFFPQTSF